MNTKPNLTELLAETSGSARHKPMLSPEPAPPKAKPSPKPKKNSPTSAITVHFPKQVRDQLKILAIQNGNTLHGIVAEAFNDFFAKHGKPEIAPKDHERSWMNVERDNVFLPSRNPPRVTNAFSRTRE